MKLTHKEIFADVCIIGGGSSGVGAAAKIAQNSSDIKVIVVEQAGLLGGTSTIGGVNCWEPGLGGPGIHYLLQKRLLSKKNQAGVGKSVHFYTPEYPWGKSEIDNSEDYSKTLRRFGLSKEEWRRFHFEPFPMALNMENILLESGNVTIMYHTSFVDAEVKGDLIDRIIVYSHDKQEYYTIIASYYIDCSGDIVVARKIGCEVSFGEEDYNRYNEPSAPEQPTDNVNGISLIFRASPVRERCIDEIPNWARTDDAREWINRDNKPDVQINEYPNGDINLNILPLMEGKEYFSLET